jgi:hypothetical protein
MSAVHGVADIHSMPAARFFQRAWRLPHYQGVMRDRAITWQQEHEQDGPRPAARSPQDERRPAPAARSEPVTQAALADPLMSKIFAFD